MSKINFVLKFQIRRARIQTFSLLLGMVGILLITVGLGEMRPAELTRVDYAAMCAQEMGTIPSFNCLNGQLIPITVGGVLQTSPVPTCDNPVQLGLSGGQCIPFSRVGELSTGVAGVQTVYICRKYFGTAGPTDPTFHDIAMIQHNRNTGHTCWFQSAVGGNLNGNSVPSPMANTAQANSFWLEPSSVASIDCQRCHDADPFIWTPYVAQVANVGNWDPLGSYVSNFANIFTQSQPVSFRPAGNACTTCHRVGASTCGNGPGLNLVTRAVNDRWMPPNHGLSATQWSQTYQISVDQLDRCCDDPNRSECNANIVIFHQFLLHTGTALHETDNTFDFAMADWDGDGIADLVAIKKSNTGTNSTEVHILSGASNFGQFILQTGTALHETDNTFDFAMADWDGDGMADLVAIKKSNTGTSSTEVHILH